MELTHRFSVPASRETTWAAFNDIESVAGCFPGAVVTGVEGDDFTGTCKVKLGPIALTYAGTGTFIEKDESSGRFVLEAKGKDKRGNGTAGATVTATMTEAGPERTDVEVLTDLSITGKPAQFGRGVIQDVSDKLLGQFMTCLEQRLGAPEAPAATYDEAAPQAGASELLEEAGAGTAAGGPEPSAAAPESAEPPLAAASAAALAASGDEAGGARAGTAGPGRRAEAGGEPDDALDLGATVLPILLKTYWKQLVGAVLVFLVLRRLLGRRGR